MILFSLMFGCVPEQNNDGFGIVGSNPDRNFDTAEEVVDTNTEDTSVEESNDDALLENPFAADSSSVCGDRTVGTDIGDCAVNFGLIDRQGEVVQLHSYAGSVLFLDLSGFGWSGCRDSGPGFNQFYLDNQSRGLVSIAAIHYANIDELQVWGQEYGGDVVLILDEAGFVYDEYKMDDYRPQYIVIDQDMTVVYKNSTPSGKSPAEQQVLSLLE